MPSPKENFEKSAPALLHGNFWRKYLSRRKTKSEPLEQTLKAFLTETLEVTKAFPEISGNLLATLSVTQLADKALEKLRGHIGRQTKLSWYDRLATYQSDIENQVGQLEQTLQELGELGNRVATAKAGDAKLTDVLLCHEDNSIHPLIEMPAYQSFVQNAKDEHYTLLQEFLKKAQEVDTFFTDLVIVNKAFEKGKESALTILKEEVNLCQQLSGTALLTLLSFDNESILKLTSDHDHYFVHPTMLLKKLSFEDWLLCLEKDIGHNMADLTEALYHLSTPLIDIIPLDVLLYLGKMYRVYTLAVLINPTWVQTITEEEFLHLIPILNEKEIPVLLANAEARKTTVERFLAILNDDVKRLRLITSDEIQYHSICDYTWLRMFRLSGQSWLEDKAFIEALCDAAFKDCFVHVACTWYNKIAAKQPYFVQRLVGMKVETVVKLFETANKDMAYCGEDFLREPLLVAKLTSDDLLCRVLRLVTEKKSIHKYRKQYPDIDARLTARFLINLVKKDFLYGDVIAQSEELIRRFSLQDIYIYLMEAPAPDESWRYFLNQKTVLETFTIQQLVTLAQVPMYYKVFLQDNNNIIARELERRAYLARPTPVAQAVYPQQSYSPAINGNHGVNNIPSINTSGDKIAPSNEKKRHKEWFHQPVSYLLFGLAAALCVGLGIAYFFFNSPLWLIIGLSIGIGITLMAGISELADAYIHANDSSHQATTKAAQKSALSPSFIPSLTHFPANTSNPVTGERHLGASPLRKEGTGISNHTSTQTPQAAL